MIEDTQNTIPGVPKPRNYTRIGLALTMFWLFTISGILYWQGTAAIVALRLNELGDFLGGTAGPLALTWLILGYLQNSEELKLQRQELELMRGEYTLQRREFEKQSEIWRDELHDQRRAEVVRARPDIRVRVSSRGVSREGCGMALSFENSAQPVRDLQLRICGGGSFRCNEPEFAVLGIGTRWDVTFGSSDPKDAERQFDFYILCRDSLGSKWTCAFTYRPSASILLGTVSIDEADLTRWRLARQDTDDPPPASNT